MDAMTVFGYCRVSGLGQVDGEGLPRQREAIHRYAETNGLRIETIFEELGVSGREDWENRPAWIDMMSHAEPGDTVVIERLDRLARDLGVQEFILRDLKKRRITLASTAEPDLGSTDPTRVLFRQIMGAVAAYERSMIEVKLRHARDRQRKANGRCEGRKPFGFREGEEAALSFIRDYFRAGFTTRTIAEALNRASLRTRSGRPWSHGTVARILNAQVISEAA